MGILKFNNVGISAISACVPKKVYHNKNLVGIMPEKAVDKLIDSIGVREKRFAEDNVTSSDLCVKAAQKLIEDNRIDVNEIDMLIFLSLTHDYITPPSSVVMQKKLGLPMSTGCFDMSMACSGFIYALSTAYAYASIPTVRKVLLCVGETMSKLINPRDKVNFPLYGDGGTACLVEKGDYGESTFLLSSDGDGEHSVIIPAGGFRNPRNAEMFEDREYEEGNFRRLTDITMDGMDTFNHAITVIPQQVRAIMRECAITNDDVDYGVFHQANKFMVDFIVKRLKMPAGKVPFCIEKFGNTSCASVPLTIVSELGNGLLDGRKRLLMSSIGVGWSYATCYITSHNVKVSNIIEY